MSKKLIPFSLYPYSWGMAGKTFERAKAEYELSGFELKKKLIQIDIDECSSKETNKKLVDLDFEYGKITKLQHLRLLAELIEDDLQKQQALLELDYKENKISEIEYQKRCATLKDEPWVNVLSMDFGGKKSLEGSFELDWNDAFVENLKREGYEGTTPDNIVNQWFMEVCRNVALEEFDGTGNFSSDSEANLETVKRWNSESIGNTRKGYS